MENSIIFIELLWPSIVFIVRPEWRYSKFR